MPGSRESMHRARGGALSTRAHQRAMAEAIRSSMHDAGNAASAAWSLAAQTNELYCKFICHNICVLISSIYELGIAPEFWKQEIA